MPRTASPRPNQPADSRHTATAEADKAAPRETWRESIESIVVAFILALLIRGFDAEAFVIPTGSMAPTLMGRHKEVVCPQCGVTYSINATDETRSPNERIVAGTCYNCRARARVDEEPSFNGDRILVMKFPYVLPWLPLAGGPERWDVVVFHYPERPTQNYIKRLVGMPGEELLITGGDIWSRPIGSDARFQICRKPPGKLRAMLMPVYNDGHRPKAFETMADWRRIVSAEPGGWAENAELPGTFAAKPVGDQVATLEYRHLVPDTWQWGSVLAGRAGEPPRPSLVDDFYSYNTDVMRLNSIPPTEPHWVGDLAVEFDVEVKSAGGQLAVILVEGGVEHACLIDLGTGIARLKRDAESTVHPDEDTGLLAKTPIKGPGKHRVAFSNVDDQMVLWVDGELATPKGLPYSRDPKEPLTPTEADLTPIRISLKGGEAEVSGVEVKRDIYYVIDPQKSDYASVSGGDLQSYRQSLELLKTPERFPELAQFDEPSSYPVRPGHYMMLGDNSPRSHDSRKWGSLDTAGGSYFDDYGKLWQTDAWTESDRQSYEVPEHLVIGKAFFVYWPHGKPIWPRLRLNRDFYATFRPYFERMKWIR